MSLKYDIYTRQLSGKVGNLSINTKAGSGGRAGSKEVDEDPFLANNPFATAIGGPSNKGTHLYGPIPRGKYTLKIHEKRSNWIRLLPAQGNVMYGRSGFAIHGRGKTGSHGCIVPDNFQVILDLIKELKKNPKTNYYLDVISSHPLHNINQCRQPNMSYLGRQMSQERRLNWP